MNTHKRIRVVTTLFALVMSHLSAAKEVTRAVFDVGSSRIKMRIYTHDTETNATQYIKKIGEQSCKGEKKINFIGEVGESGKISQDTIDNAISQIKDLRVQAVKCGATQLRGFATEAFRLARNGKSAARKISRGVGFKITRISQREEAFLGYQSALKLTEDLANYKKVCVWEIGSGSMQMTCAKTDSLDRTRFFANGWGADPFSKIGKWDKGGTQKAISTNPYTIDDVNYARGVVRREAIQMTNSLRSYITDADLVLGIGGVHNYAISKVLSKELGEVFTADEIENNMLGKLGLADAALCDFDPKITCGFVGSALSNMALVSGLMRELGIEEVRNTDSSGTQTVAETDSFWK